MELFRRRGLHVAAVLILVVALGVTAYPASWTENLEAASTAILAGRLDLALPALADAIALEPEVPALHMRAAQGALASDEANQAIDYLSQVPGNESRIECLELGVKIRAGLIEEALDQLERARCPDQAVLLREEANLLFAAGDYQEAKQILDVLQISLPATPEASEMLGTLIAVHDPENALSFLRLAIDLDPEAASLAYELIKAIESARSEENASFTLAQVGQTLARAEMWSLAATAFENALLHDPDYTEARAYYGLALDRSGQDGLSELERAAAEAPQASLPRVLLGKHWLISGEPIRAVEAYEQAAVLAPEDPFVAVDLGAAYAATGDMSAARLAYLYAANLAPDDAALWSLLAQFSLDYEIDLDEIGLPAARQVVMLQPRDAAALDRLGFTHFLLGNWVLAERFIMEAIQVDSSLASAQYHLGLLRLAAGDIAGGRSALASATALDPDGRLGNLARRSLENLNP